ncbi:MAG: RNA-binding domain-containing protein [Euryarchaeota archaeon]
MATTHRVRRKKAFHSIAVSAFVQGTEDESKVATAFRLIVPENVRIDRQPVTGHFGNAIVVLKAQTGEAQAIRQVIDAIRNKLPKRDLMQLRRQIPQYLSERCTLVVKFNKQTAACGALELGTNDPIVVRARIAAYPARVEIAVEIARDVLNNECIC